MKENWGLTNFIVSMVTLTLSDRSIVGYWERRRIIPKGGSGTFGGTYSRRSSQEHTRLVRRGSVSQRRYSRFSESGKWIIRQFAKVRFALSGSNFRCSLLSKKTQTILYIGAGAMAGLVAFTDIDTFFSQIIV